MAAHPIYVDTHANNDWRSSIRARLLIFVVALVLFVSDATQSVNNVYSETPKQEVHFLKDNLSLAWMTSLPDDDILWCYWKYELGGAWDQFLGYHNVDKKRLNISPWNKGWEYLNPTQPCQGGIMRQNVTSEYTGNYVMVIADHNGTEYDSLKSGVNVAACPRPKAVPGVDIMTFTFNNTLFKLYKCNNHATGGTSHKVKCHSPSGIWERAPEICGVPEPFSGPKMTALEVALIIVVVMLCCIIVFIILYIKKCLPCIRRRTNRTDEDTHPSVECIPLQPVEEMPQHFPRIDFKSRKKSAQDHLELGEVFTLKKVDFHGTLRLAVVVISSPRATVQWFRENKPLHHKINRVRIQTKRSGVHRLEIRDVNENDSGVYTVRATNGVSDPVEHSSHITVKTDDMFKPHFSKSLCDNITVEAGILSTFDGIITGKPTPTVTCCHKGELLNDKGRIHLHVTPQAETDDVKVQLICDKPTQQDTGELMIKVENIIGQVEHTILLEVHCCCRITKLTNVEIYPGEDAVFEATIEGFPAPSVAWYKDKELLYSTKELQQLDANIWLAQLHLPSCQSKYAGEIKLKVINLNNVTNEKFAKLSFKKPVKPSFRISLSDHNRHQGENIVLSVEATGMPIPTITWLKDNHPLDISDRIEQTSSVTSDMAIVQTCTVHDCVKSDSGWYKALATSVSGEEQSLAHVTVSDLTDSDVKPNFIIPLTSKSVNDGDDVIFNVTVETNLTPSVEWFLKGAPVQNTERVYCTERGEGKKLYAKLFINECTPADSGVVTVKATNSAGETEDMATLKLNTKPHFEEVPPESVDVQTGSSINIIVRASGEPKPKVKWHLSAVIQKCVKERVLDDVYVLELTNLTFTDSRKCKVTAVNQCGMATHEFSINVIGHDNIV